MCQQTTATPTVLQTDPIEKLYLSFVVVFVFVFAFWYSFIYSVQFGQQKTTTPTVLQTDPVEKLLDYPTLFAFWYLSYQLCVNRQGQRQLSLRESYFGPFASCSVFATNRHLAAFIRVFPSARLARIKFEEEKSGTDGRESHTEF